jgi:hypothetical protein
MNGDSLAVDRVRETIASGHNRTHGTLAADEGGAWVVARGDGDLLRVEEGRIVSRIGVPEAIGPVAIGDGAVWVVSGDPNLRDDTYRLSHIDSEDGEVTTIDVGPLPKALVATGDDVWVVAADGTARLVDPGT